MGVPDDLDLSEIAKGLGSDQLAEIADFIAFLKSRLESRLEGESKAWLEAVEPIEPFDWGEADPLTMGLPVDYVEGKGATVRRA